MPLAIKKTHRGPIIASEDLRFNAALLFGGAIGELVYPDAHYSFGWGGSFVGDVSFDLLNEMYYAPHIPALIESVDRLVAVDGYRGMAGNVREWVEDSWHSSHEGAPADGSARAGSGAIKVVRGGSYADGADALRSGARSSLAGDAADATTGFRVVRVVSD